MNTKDLIIGLVVLIIVIIFIMFSLRGTIYPKPVTAVSGAEAPIIVYKTRADYSNFVSAGYDTKNQNVDGVVSPRNFASAGELITDSNVINRPKLVNDYILGYGIYTINTVFLNFTLEEYNNIKPEDIVNPSRTDIPPLLSYLTDNIKDKDPFLEFYDCSESRKQYRDLISKEKTEFIDACLKDKQIDLNIYEYYEQHADYFKDYSPSDPKFKTGTSDLLTTVDVEILDESKYSHRFLYLSAKYGADVGNCSTEFYSVKFPEEITYGEELFNYINEYIVKTNQLSEKCIKIK